MDGCLISLQNFLPIAGILSLFMVGLIYLAYYFGQKNQGSKTIPSWWEKTAYSVMVVFICLIFISYKSLPSIEAPGALFISKAEAGKLLQLDGEKVIASILLEVDVKLRELDKQKQGEVNPAEDLFLLQENILGIIHTGRERLTELGSRLPNGDLLGEAMSKAYPEEEFRKDFDLLCPEVLKPGISHRERMKAIEAFTKRKQLKLLERIIAAYY